MGGLVNLFFGNHDGRGVEMLRDLSQLLRGGLEALGCPVRMTVELPEPEAVNIVFGPFDDRSMWRLTRRLSGLAYGIVLREPFDGERFLGERSGAEHVANFVRLARDARFVWTIDRSSLPHLARLTGREVGHLQMGYSSILREAEPAGEDEMVWDAALLAEPTPYRQEQLERLRAAGLRVYEAQRFLPPHVRASQLPRARLLLDLRRTPDWPYVNAVQIAFMLCNDYCVVSESCPNDEPVQAFTTLVGPENLVERCAQLLESARWRELGRANGARFRTAMPMERLLAPIATESAVFAAPGPSRVPGVGASPGVN